MLTDNPLVVYEILGAAESVCDFYGVNGSDTFVIDNSTGGVQPPQVQIAGSCLYNPPPP